jgi:hypothetical protein
LTAFFDLFAHFIDRYSELNSDFISGAVNYSGKSILIVFSLLFTSGQVYHGTSMIITYSSPLQVCFFRFSVILTAFFDFLTVVIDSHAGLSWPFHDYNLSGPISGVFSHIFYKFDRFFDRFEHVLLFLQINIQNPTLIICVGL